ncbi:MAG: toxin-antitoxin system YwqK family antitoxin [Tenuifilaceae bacterium]
MKNFLILTSIIIVIITSCVNNSNKRVPGQPFTEFEGTSANGIKKIYNAEGKLETEIPYKDSLPDGIQKEYYKTGQLFRETPLEKGLANGIVKEYSTNGKIYREMPVTNGRANGIIKKYYTNGVLFSEAPFENGQPAPGLKEYDESGKLLEKPTLVFKAKNLVNVDGTFELEVSLSDPDTKAAYSQILIFENKEMPNKLLERNGKGILKFSVQKGLMMTKQLTFEARYTTIRNNMCIIRGNYNLVID